MESVSGELDPFRKGTDIVCSASRVSFSHELAGTSFFDDTSMLSFLSHNDTSETNELSRMFASFKASSSSTS